MADSDAGLPNAKRPKLESDNLTEEEVMQLPTAQQSQETLDKPAENAQTNSANNEDMADVAQASTELPRCSGKKRKVALYVAYIGTGYYVRDQLCDRTACRP